MKKAQSIVMMFLMVFVLLGVANADWNPGDPYKMHWPQLPDPYGWDVHASEPFIVADDFECAETGWIQDIHFWGSWYGGYFPPLTELFGFWISIHADIPASQNPNGPYSQPGTILLNKFYDISNFVVAGPFYGEQGWYDPIQGFILPFDHFEYFQYNLQLPQQDWVHQTEGNIYWLNISAVVFDPFTFPWGWKTTTHDLIFQDTSVWTDQFMYPDPWLPIYDPLYGPPEHLDLAFVITGEPEQEPTMFGVETECPVVETFCPDIPTWCPIDPTFCPKEPFTQCPLEYTICPEEPTWCPTDWTYCPDWGPTWCPEFFTECPMVPTECFPLDTECSFITTQCPIEFTWCPVEPTFCPDQFVPTWCYFEPTICPYEETICPTEFTLCPDNSTWCPEDITNCPMEWTNCPSPVPTACPASPTICSMTDTDADGIDDCNDNCPNHPNGPNQGTCTKTVGVNLIVSTGQFCTVDGDCDAGEFCEKTQADNYPPGGNGIGDACDCEANFNCDTNVDATDVAAFLLDFGRSIFFNPCTNALPCNGDFLCDEDVDANDVTKFLEDFGRSTFFQPCPICPGGPWCLYP